MNRENMISYILAWENHIEGTELELATMTDEEVKRYYLDSYNAYEGQLPPPDPSEIDPLDNYHLTF